MKRFLDVVGAAVLLALTAPLIAVAALALRIRHGGPVLFRQRRSGRGGAPFELLKLRTMSDPRPGREGPEFDAERMHRLGGWLRATSIDELPELINVLRGEMSFVGPRPERPQFVDMLNREVRYYSVRHCMKPGLTGWAQLRYPYGASVNDAAEKLRYDLFYVKNHGLLFDLLIMLQTVEVVMFGRGAR